jgi:predicted transposase YbfD/YdcC
MVKQKPARSSGKHTHTLLPEHPRSSGSQADSTAIRGHWSIDNLNHYKRDTSLWREDDHRHRRVPIALNLALTRYALPKKRCRSLPRFWQNA